MILSRVFGAVVRVIFTIALSQSVFGQQLFLRHIKRILVGNIINNMTVSNFYDCATLCQTTDDCVAFNVNRQDKKTLGQLMCQILTNKDDIFISPNEQFDCYKGSAVVTEDNLRMKLAEPISIYLTSTLKPTTTMTTGDKKEIETTTQSQWPCDSESKLYTWKNAKQHCEDKGKQLPIIQNQKIQQDVDNLISSVSSTRFWIGLYTIPNDIGFEWKWVDESVTYNFSNWNQGEEPNNLQMKTQPFYTYINSTTGKWFLTPNGTACIRYMCVSTCHGSENSYTWKNAKQYCIDNNKKFAILNSPQLQQTAETILSGGQCDSFWFGLYTVPNGTSFEWKWVDESLPYNYSNWDQEIEPNDPQMKTIPFYAYIKRQTGKWFITSNGNECRELIWFWPCDSTEALYTWQHAKERCENTKTQFAILNNPWAQQRIEKIMVEAHAGSCWFGLYTKPNGTSFEWKWVDESLPYNFSNWDRGIEPNDPQMISEPFYAYVDGNTRKWFVTQNGSECKNYLLF